MKKVLIIEDDPIVAHVYRSRLEKEGFTVDVAADGQTGYYRLYDERPHAMLLDLMLPKLNGIDLLKKIRAVREFEKLPVVVFTNAYVTNMIHEAFTAGASAVYNKSSVTPRQIIDVINTLLAPPQGTAPAPAPAAATPVITTAPAVPPAAAAPRPAASPSGSAFVQAADDSNFQRELLSNFGQTSQTTLNEMRRLLQELNRADDLSRPTHVEQLYRKLRAYGANAAMVGLPHVAKMSAAIEALLKEMMEKPKTTTLSTIRTTAHAIDFLSELSKPGVPPDLAENPPVNILTVDDEMLSQRAIVYALEKAFLKPVPVDDAQAALVHTKATKFDLIFLDVNMPGLDGFQLCDKLREQGPNRTTPVIFVTSTADFQARAQSTLRGASDLIAKPFMFIELTVKALTFALRHRLEQRKQMRAGQAAQASATPVPAPRPSELVM
jgi:DNA-binding response OmpR family regulator